MAKRNHYYIMCATMVYAKDETVKQRQMNTIAHGPSKNFTSVLINNARIALMQRLFEEADIEVTAMRDFIITNVSYLGYMTAAEFEGQTEH